MKQQSLLIGLYIVALGAMNLAPAADTPAPSATTPAAARAPTPVGQTAVCIDIPDSWPLRSKITGEHLKYIDTIKDRMLIGGPVRGPDRKPNGSIIVYKTESLEEAKQLLANDPFSKHQLFARCDWYSFVQYVGTYVGGWAGPH
jgi:uncharacterized protein YciI